MHLYAPASKPEAVYRNDRFCRLFCEFFVASSFLWMRWLLVGVDFLPRKDVSNKSGRHSQEEEQHKEDAQSGNHELQSPHRLVFLEGGRPPCLGIQSVVGGIQIPLHVIQKIDVHSGLVSDDLRLVPQSS